MAGVGQEASLLPRLPGANPRVGEVAAGEVNLGQSHKAWCMARGHGLFPVGKGGLWKLESRSLTWSDFHLCRLLKLACGK